MIDDNQLTPEEQPTPASAGPQAEKGQPADETSEQTEAGNPESAEMDVPTEKEEIAMPVEEKPTTEIQETTPAEGTPVEPALEETTPVDETTAVDAAAVEAAAPVNPEDEAQTVQEYTEESELDSTPDVVAEAAPEVAEPTVPVSAESVVVEEGTSEEEHDELTEEHHTDYTNWSKQDLVNLLDTTLIAVKQNTADMKATDRMLREVKTVFDHFKTVDRQDAFEKYTEEGGEEQGFSFKADEATQKFDSLYGQIKGERNKHFQQVEKNRESNFAKKTELLNKLRELVENEEKSGAGVKSWDTFKQIQADWKGAGNIASAHNNTLWQTYHALVDRYFNNRNIYFELKELDRKRNMQSKIELIERVEKIVALVQDGGEVSGKMLDESNELFEEFKHIGPAPKEVNEELWKRFKSALDVLFAKKREQNESQKTLSEETYKIKSEIASLAETFTTFQSNSINEWNDKTKALLAVQDQWNAIKGPLPRDKGREMSQKFWADIKAFFRNKGEFFRQLEIKRDENLRLKTALCEQAEGLLASGDDSADATNTVIELQRRWKSIGHVPEKMRDKIFDRFKKACDAFFEKKRNKNAGIEKEYENNLALKKALCEEIETDAAQGVTDLEKLSTYKSRWSAIGYVPRKEMQNIQQRYIKAINSYVAASGKLSAQEKEQLVLENEVELVKQERGRGGSVDLRGRENDIRRKIKTLEDEIAQTENNMAFFARSKNADKIKQDFEKRVAKSRSELDQLLHQLKVVREAED